MTTTTSSEHKLVEQQLKFNLSVITKLSSQSDSLSLIDTMINALLSVPAIISVAIYEAHHNKGLSIMTTADISQLGVKLLREQPWQANDGRVIPASVYECVLTHSHSSDIGKANCVSIPVLPADGPVGHVLYLQFKGEAIMESLLKTTQTMFSVFGNLLKLFDKLERDSLTGFFNGNSLEKSLVNYCAQVVKSAKASNRSAEQVWIVAIRVAQIQQTALERGQRHADEILLKMSLCLEKNFRNTDLFFRRSVGDFYVLLPCNDENFARIAIERLMVSLEALKLDAGHTFNIVYSLIQPEQPAMTQLGELMQALNKLESAKQKSMIQSLSEVRAKH